MKKQYYDMIFKRKSFHLFRGLGEARLSAEELREIEEACRGFEPLCPGIRTAFRIVPAEKVNFKRDAEYCVMIYSEKKDNYLMNAGYLGEQLDLYLASRDIGSLWFGIGKPDENEFDGLSYVIMIAIHKVDDPTKFRRDMYKSKRKSIAEIWEGEDYGIADVSRFAPSAVNSQPWRVKSENGTLSVYRYKKNGRTGLMPAAAVSYFNRIDLGIYLCILELCMEQGKIGFDRALFTDNGGDQEMTLCAKYKLI